MQTNETTNEPHALILASGSPRRREFFKRMGWEFSVVKPGTEERVHPGETPEQYVKRNAEEKSAAALAAAEAKGGKPAVVVAADTVVVQDGRILEKPRDEADAARMLRELSGRCHQVMTGLCVRTAEGFRSRTVVTDVEFKVLGEEEITAYIRSGEPMDKAGAYAIQGLAAYMIRSVRGSYTNVVGLPLAETVEELEAFGFVPRPVAEG